MTEFGIYGDLHVSLEGHVATAEIRRPPNNFFDLALIDGLVSAFTALDEDDNCGSIVLCAEGKNICAGAQFHHDGTRGGACCGCWTEGLAQRCGLPRRGVLENKSGAAPLT